jgi:putative tryptophan/tyrosine transport system substrate-binding protein
MNHKQIDAKPGDSMTSLRHAITTSVFALLTLFLSAPAPAADVAPRVARIGYLSMNAPTGVGAGLITAELAKLGYVEGRNIVFEIRHAGGDPTRLPGMAAELVKLEVDVIYAVTIPAAMVAKAATSKIPIVAWGMHGAVQAGLVPSLRHPGGNLTGTETLAPEIDPKRIQLLKQIVPGLNRLAVVFDATDHGTPAHLKAIADAEKSLGLTTSNLPVTKAAELDAVLAAAAGKPLGAVLTLTSNLTFNAWPRIRDFAQAQRLPTLCEFRPMAQSGCLLSYGPTFEEITQRSAAQIDKILRGVAPGDLPMEQPTRFELIINLKTAKALGLTVPQELLLRADAVIE